MRGWWILAGSSAGLFMLMLDSTATALALPSIRLDLGSSSSGLQWVQNAYLLSMAALVIAMGRIGDVLGRRLMFVAGMLVFGAGSVVCATAASTAVLVAGRTLQGAGGAAMLALSLAIVTTAFPEAGRARAVGIWAALSSVALAVGPMVGGTVVELASWRWLFWLNLVLIAAGVVVIALAMPESRDESASRRLDLAGLATLSSGLTLVVLALVQGKPWGFGSLATLGSLAAGLALLAGFFVVERRAREPLMELELFRSRPYLGASAAAFALVGSYWTIMFLLPQYIDLVLRFSTLRSGILMLPVTVPMVLISPIAARLTRLLGARTIMTAGMAAATAGMLLLARVDGSSSYEVIAPGLLLFGVALGLVYAPMSAAAMAALPSEKAGVASGVLAMTRCLAGALLLAICGALFQHVQVEDRAAGGSFESAFAGGIASACVLMAIVLALGTLLTWLLIRSAPGAHEPQHHRFHL